MPMLKLLPEPFKTIVFAGMAWCSFSVHWDILKISVLNFSPIRDHIIFWLNFICDIVTVLNSKLYIISKCIDIYEESRTSVKRSFVIAFKFSAVSQLRII